VNFCGIGGQIGAQTFRYDRQNRIVSSAAPGMCLTAMSSSDGSVVALQECDNTAGVSKRNQRWFADANKQWRPYSSYNTTCLHLSPGRALVLSIDCQAAIKWTTGGKRVYISGQQAQPAGYMLP
jgi:hypothetical protein